MPRALLHIQCTLLCSCVASHPYPYITYLPKQSLVLECDLQHYLTYPQLCREILAFLLFCFKLIVPFPFTLFHENLTFALSCMLI